MQRKRVLAANLPSIASFIGLALAFVFVPFITFLSTRSAPAVLSFATLFLLLGAYWRAETWRDFAARFTEVARQPLAIAIASFVLAAFASVSWSVEPLMSLQYSFRLLGNCLLGFAFVVVIAGEHRRHIMKFLVVGLVITLPLLANELHGPFQLRQPFSDTLGSESLNRAVLVTSILAALFLALACAEKWLSWLALFLSVVAAVVAVLSSSQSSVLFWGVVVIAWPLAVYAPRATARAVTATAFACLVLFPFFAMLYTPWMRQLLGGVPEDVVHATSAEIRLSIWENFAELIPHEPLLGWGYYAERAMSKGLAGPAASAVIGSAHPHDVAIQLWVDFGLLGVFVAGLIGFAWLRRLLQAETAVLTAASAITAGVFAVWMVSHGAWQEWWLAMMSLVFATLLRSTPGGQAISFWRKAETPAHPPFPGATPPKT
ncbi:O-antigen ligase family protein [Afifella sp. YEN Y35]|uniref:O-antigen ligase family protein n=1 Tax=Afifella sp. YEN Y35 TaxID=3388337 RepID=UPI0039DFE1CF